MKLLICTQVVDQNHPILGFFHRWIEEFAKHCEEVHVIALEVGEYELPEHVHIYSLGKDKRTASSLRYAWRLNRLAWQLRHRYDGVFCHMNPEYSIAGGFLWRLLRKRHTLWYAHGNVSFRLRFSELFLDNIFTSTSSGLDIRSDKKVIVGQGIDLRNFSSSADHIAGSTLKLVCVGRIEKIKNPETLIDACHKINSLGYDCSLTFIGPLANNNLYLNSLQDMIDERCLRDKVVFYGSIANRNIPRVMKNYDFFVSDSGTKSLDKALIESVACRLLTVSSNLSFTILAPEEVCFTYNDSSQLVEKVIALANNDNGTNQVIKDALYENLAKKNSVSSLVKNIISHF